MINEKTGLREAILALEPGEYEYKFIIDDVWQLDQNKEANENGNNVLKIEKNCYNVYENLVYPRTLFNRFQKKMAEKYPEMYLEKRVSYWALRKFNGKRRMTCSRS